MIYTLTLNPSIDYIMRLDEFTDGKTLRSTSEEKYPGGKGIMVAKLLKNLGADPINLGFIGGFTGDFIVKGLRDLDIKEDFTPIANDSRINVKLKYQTETEVNAGGPEISEAEIANFLERIKSLDDDATLILSGSIPKSLPKDFYKEILNIKDFNFTIDVAGKELLDYLKHKPVLVKPNIDELSEIFDVEITDQNVFDYAKKLNQLGAKNVIISMGADGSIFVDENLMLRAKPVDGKLINSVGAGDSMVAGFIYGLSHGYGKVDSYKQAVAAGSATAFSPDIAEKELIDEIYVKVELENYGN